MSDQTSAGNRILWDYLAEIHARSGKYGTDVLRAGGSTLRSVEMNLLGEVAGQSVLHSHCHIGCDTLSLAKLGAIATGVDFSTAAIKSAIALSHELAIPCRFQTVHSWKDPLPGGPHDLFFASYGVLDWISNLEDWFVAAASTLKAGGRLLLIDSHPLFQMVSYVSDLAGGRYLLTDSYSSGGSAILEPLSGDYADRTVDLSAMPTHRWKWGFSDVLTAALRKGFKLRRFEEHYFAHYPKFSHLVENKEGYFEDPIVRDLPMLFALELTKETLDNVAP